MSYNIRGIRYDRKRLESAHSGRFPHWWGASLFSLLFGVGVIGSSGGHTKYCRGGCGMSNAKFYESEKWRRKRQQILKRDGYLDQVVKRYGKSREAHIVHHVFPLDEFPEYRLTDWNLISISMATHNRLHDRDTGLLSDDGVELLRRIARRNGIEIPQRYRTEQSPPSKS